MPKATKKKPPPKKADNGSKKETEAEIAPHRKLYIGNLTGLDMTDLKLRQTFEVCGEITEVELITTNSHAFGFVEFATIEAAASAIEKMNGESGMLVKFGKVTSVPASTPVQASNVVDADVAEDEDDEADGEDKPASERAPLVSIAEARTAAGRKYPNPEETLQGLVQKATRASSTKDHIIYIVEEDDMGLEFIAVVELKVPAGTHTARGEPQDKKADARKSAARVALRDPEVHRLLPPLPTKEKLREPKEAKAPVAESSDDEHQHEEERPEDSAKASAALSAKQQKQVAKAAKAEKNAKRKAAKAAAKAAEEEESDHDEEEDDSDDEDSASVEESSEAEGEMEDSSDGDDEDGIDVAALTAKKAAIKAALAAKKKPKPSAKRDTKDKVAGEAKKKIVQKAGVIDLKMAEKVQDGRKQENFGATKFIKP